MTTSYIDCSRTNPYRPPHWRWLRAMGIINGTQPNAGRRKDGTEGFKWINRARRFQQAQQQAVSDAAKIQLVTQYPDIFWAHHAYENETPIRWEMEARILARCNNWEIGFYCGLDEDIVKAYEALFFNVREKLHHRGYITHIVMGESVQRGLSEREYDLLWKMYGYAFGPQLLEAVTTKFANPAWCGTADEIGAAIEADTVNTMKMKASLAAKTVPVNIGTQLEILHIFTKYVEIERMSDNATKGQNQIVEHIGAMFNVMPLNVAGHDPRLGQKAIAGPVQRYEDTAVELSYDETMTVATGGRLPNHELLANMHFPPTPVEIEVTESKAGGS